MDNILTEPDFIRCYSQLIAYFYPQGVLSDRIKKEYFRFINTWTLSEFKQCCRDLQSQFEQSAYQKYPAPKNFFIWKERRILEKKENEQLKKMNKPREKIHTEFLDGFLEITKKIINSGQKDLYENFNEIQRLAENGNIT